LSVHDFELAFPAARLQIAQAKAQGDTRALTSLERQRGEMARCSTEGLEQKRRMALEQAQKRIDQRQADLDKARAGGDEAKIKSAQRSLDNARKVYADIKNAPL
jgi:carbamoylphosphate synthase small subunit